MKWCWFSLSAFTVSTSRLYLGADCPSLFFSLSHFYASVLRLALSHSLISFVLIPCRSPALHFSLTLARSLLYHTLILCDVKLITLPPFLSVSLPSLCPSVVWKWLWWMAHWVVHVCGCDDDHACWETGERWGTGRGYRRRRQCVISYQRYLATDVLPQCSSIWNYTIFTAQDN